MHQEITITLERNLVSKITQSSENRDGGEIKWVKEREEISNIKKNEKIRVASTRKRRNTFFKEFTHSSQI